MKTTVRTNYRVEITPARPFTESHEAWVVLCRQIERSVRRHVDDVQQTRVLYDTEHRCSHCGSEWEVWDEASIDQELREVGVVAGMPACCGAAQEKFLREVW